MSEQNKFDAERYTSINDESSQWKEASEIEIKIFRATGYNAEKVEAIRELMEEEAVNFMKAYQLGNIKFDKEPDDESILYKLYQQSKTK